MTLELRQAIQPFADRLTAGTELTSLGAETRMKSSLLDAFHKVREALVMR